MYPPENSCPDCSGPGQQNRREFLRTTGRVGLAAAAATFAHPAPLLARPVATASSETLVAQLYDDLTEKQKQLCVLPFDHELRSRVDANWHITKARIATDFTADQQALIRDIFRQLHSEQYANAIYDQVEHDGGFGNCSIALFGQPGSGKFEFVLTGRHVTRRCDGDSVDGTAFGGPIFYGHAAEGFNESADHPGNAYWYQAKRANELFAALDGKQRAIALLDEPRAERGNQTVALAAKPDDMKGLPVSEMSTDQQELARHVMHDVLAPFREVDRKESMQLIEKNGFDQLRFSFYKNLDIGNDGVWDVWQVEGPAMVWYFRGSPHVHTWVHIRDQA
jgi:hypothetical protein